MPASHWQPEPYLAQLREGTPDYELLQRALVAATADIEVGAILELGVERAQLEAPLPQGPFDLVVSALAVHRLDGPAQADLFTRVRAVLRPGGRFVLADVVAREEPRDAVVPLDESYDLPSPVADQLVWLAAAGFEHGRVTWRRDDLAVLAAERSGAAA